MRRHNIEINDLYQAVAARREELQFENDVHFRPEGSRILGEQVASRIRAVLETRRRHSSPGVRAPAPASDRPRLSAFRPDRVFSLQDSR